MRRCDICGKLFDPNEEVHPSLGGCTAHLVAVLRRAAQGPCLGSPRCPENASIETDRCGPCTARQAVRDVDLRGA